MSVQKVRTMPPKPLGFAGRAEVSINPGLGSRIGGSIPHYAILYSTLLYSAILYYAKLYYTMLYDTILYFTILYYTILYDTILYYILYYTILYDTILYDTIPYYTIPYDTIPDHTILYQSRIQCQSTPKLAATRPFALAFGLGGAKPKMPRPEGAI